LTGGKTFLAMYTRFKARKAPLAKESRLEFETVN